VLNVPTSPTRPATPLTFQFPQRRVLVVEDDVWIGMDVKSALDATGCQVLGPIATVNAAIRTVTSNRLDAAVLDINLGKELSFPIADALTSCNVPFLFLTAYDRATLPTAYRDKPVIAKPFLREALVRVLARIFRM
jgi:DNA-binding response OmpR family regulator